MAWTAPTTWVANQVLTAAQLNTHLRDNMNEMDVAKVTGRGDYVVSTGANALTVRQYDTDRINTAQSTASTSYTDLGTVGPSVTVVTGSRAGVFFGAQMLCSGASDIYMKVSYAITGATASGASDTRSMLVDGIPSGNAIQNHQADFRTDLTPGTNTFTLKYACGGTSTEFANRWIAVFGL